VAVTAANCRLGSLARAYMLGSRLYMDALVAKPHDDGSAYLLGNRDAVAFCDLGVSRSTPSQAESSLIAVPSGCDEL
jgi:hypothetical protein